MMNKSLFLSTTPAKKPATAGVHYTHIKNVINHLKQRLLHISKLVQLCEREEALLLIREFSIESALCLGDTACHLSYLIKNKDTLSIKQQHAVKKMYEEFKWILMQTTKINQPIQNKHFRSCAK